MSRRLVPALTVTALAAALSGCVPEQSQVAPPVASSASAAPSAAAVNASVQRARAAAEKAREAARRAEEAARRAQAAAIQAQAVAPRPATVDPRLALYQGERIAGTATVHGVSTYPDGGRYEGQFIGHLGVITRHGSGVAVTAAGTRYAGDWVHDKMSGYGALARVSGPGSYEGEWVDAQRSGHGVLTDEKGESYAGEFRDNRPQGLGAVFDAQGKPKLSGAWNTGAPAPTGVSSYGSGFVVTSAGAVLTNEHVVRACRTIEVREENGAFAPATLLRVDAAKDLALIDTARPRAHVAAFRDSGALREGEEIVVYGFPFAAQISPGGTVTSGIVSSLFGLRGAAHQLQITAPVQVGSSGGPVLDRQGRVVGVVQSKLNALQVASATGDVPQNVNFAVKSADAVALMRDAGLQPPPTPAPAGQKRIEDIAEAAKRVTVLVRCNR